MLQQRKNAYFNSQPHKEADSNVQADLRIEEYFNSQPHKEADYKSLANAKKEWNFNSQPHKEADIYNLLKQSGAHVFQFTASQGG